MTKTQQRRHALFVIAWKDAFSCRLVSVVNYKSSYLVGPLLMERGFYVSGVDDVRAFITGGYERLSNKAGDLSSQMAVNSPHLLVFQA